MTRPKRKSKQTTLQEAARLVSDGDRIATGGFGTYQNPMAFVHELIRQRRKDLTVVGIVNGGDVDILAGAGCLRRVETSYVGFEKHGLAPNFRRQVESGTLQIVDYPEILSMDRFRASQENFSFWPAYFLGGNDLLRVNPEIKEFQCPLTGKRAWAVPPAAPDVVVIHAPLSDEYGNVLIPSRRLTPQSLDITMARSCDRVIVTVEKIVPTATLRRHPHLVELPSYRTTAVVEVPWGAHPTAMLGVYGGDDAHVELYLQAARSQATFDAYLHEYVHGTTNHIEYLERIGLPTLLSLRKMDIAL
jgi:glutaconate CoA-transferase subunit A